MILFTTFIILLPADLFSMHIIEGFLPISWSAGWYIASMPFLLLSIKKIRKLLESKPELKMLIIMAGAFTFVLSALKLPSVAGSSSHPTGVGLGTLMFGPILMCTLGLIVLLFQALLLAHGGITTLGANLFSMSIIGPLVTYAVYRICSKLRIYAPFTIVVSTFFGNLTAYLATSLQLALAYPDSQSGVKGALIKFAGIFAVTQIPIAFSEGILTLIIINILFKYATDEMRNLEIINLIEAR